VFRATDLQTNRGDSEGMKNKLIAVLHVSGRSNENATVKIYKRLESRIR
jgi:hypothetical protein